MNTHTIYLSILVIIITLAGLVNAQEWEAYSQRPALKGIMTVDKDDDALIIVSDKDFHCNSAWRKPFDVEAGKYYKIHAEYNAWDVELERRSIFVKVDWKDAEGKRVSRPEYPPNAGHTSDGWKIIEGIYPAPEDAVSAQVELIFRWSERGGVKYRNVSFAQADAPPARVVKLATVNFRARGTSGADENRELYCKYASEAGEQGADIVCLPEGTTVVGNPQTYLEVAEPVPGPSSKALGKVAKKYSMYIVAGIYERVGNTVYNTAILLDREGKVMGTYRKVALPREEIEGGLTPGDDFPVFEADFGKIGMMICWDVHFPEAARRMAYDGAEVIFLPIWGGNEHLFGARAIENQLYLVTSGFDAKTGIWDREGKIVAEADEEGELAFYEIDLAKRTLWRWLGDFRARIPREAPPVREN